MPKTTITIVHVCEQWECQGLIISGFQMERSVLTESVEWDGRTDGRRDLVGTATLSHLNLGPTTAPDSSENARISRLRSFRVPVFVYLVPVVFGISKSGVVDEVWYCLEMTFLPRQFALTHSAPPVWGHIFRATYKKTMD
ncbi:hypothetical protein BXZ70DRAFT_907483 [Cristinia sonorae]|uniref:Uncharacterized protein n=1 Tax=Cristinia sonorae TaxID=1940300 RepID=A0A8K0UNZ2_9AGAR|nr:hypothetical protein BXZ70DRAFT_907483 [Cristinia sonorae]